MQTPLKTTVFRLKKASASIMYVFIKLAFYMRVSHLTHTYIRIYVVVNHWVPGIFSNPMTWTVGSIDKNRYRANGRSGNRWGNQLIQGHLMQQILQLIWPKSGMTTNAPLSPMGPPALFLVCCFYVVAVASFKLVAKQIAFNFIKPKKFWNF